jgi:hypothetical protein
MCPILQTQGIASRENTPKQQREQLHRMSHLMSDVEIADLLGAAEEKGYFDDVRKKLILNSLALSLAILQKAWKLGTWIRHVGITYVCSAGFCGWYIVRILHLY